MEPSLVTMTVILMSFLWKADILECRQNTKDKEEVVGVKGDAAFLPVDLEEWGGFKKSFYVKLFKSSSLVYSARWNQAKKNVESWSPRNFAGRISIEISPSRIKISDLRAEDEGVYKSEIVFIGVKSDHTFYLTVIVPPSSPVIMMNNGKRVFSRAGPFREGEVVNLTCEVTGGRPTPQVTWWHNLELIDDIIEVNSTDVTQNILEEGPLTREDFEKFLICQASNSRLLQPFIANVKLDIYYKPVSVNLTSNVNELVAGQEYELQCHSSGARPPAQIAWTLNGGGLNDTDEVTYGIDNSTLSTLRYIPEDFHDGLLISCIAESPVIEDSQIEDTRSLNILYAPKLQLELVMPNIRGYKEGDNVYFICDVQAKPDVDEIEWFHKGLPLSRSQKDKYFIINNSLNISSVSRSDSGVYSCTATNQVGRGSSNPVILSVRHKPVCMWQEVRMVGAAKQQEVSVTCKVHAVPQTFNFRWHMNTTSHELIDFPSVTFDVKDRTSRLTFVAHTDMDYGLLYCHGVNILGESVEPCIYNIMPISLPGKPHDCTLGNQTWNSFTVECKEGFDGGLEQQFTAELVDITNSEIITNISGKTPLFAFSELPPSADFVVTIYSSNEMGNSGKFNIQAFTYSRPEEIKSEPSPKFRLPVKPILAVLIGVVVCLVVVSFVLLIILKLRGASNGNKVSVDSGPAKEPQPPAPVVQQQQQQPSSDHEYEDVSGGTIPSKLKHANIYETMQYESSPKVRRKQDEEEAKDEEDPNEDDLAYAELLFDTSSKTKKGTRNGHIPPKHENTIYASIDHKQTQENAENAKRGPIEGHLHEGEEADNIKEDIPLMDATLETGL